MLLKIDCRENKLIPLVEDLVTSYNTTNSNNTITLETGNLNIGDIMIIDDSDKDNYKNLLIIERKTINDLASSINDGRYTEQSFRLDKSSIHNHNIIYLIEGDIRQYNGGTRINKNTLYSSMVSLNTYKGFSLQRSFDINETANIILQTVCKVIKNKFKTDFHYKNEIDESNESNESNESTESNESNESNKSKLIKKTTEYIDVIKQTKKSNINKDNVNEIMLSQLPSVSINVSKTVMSKFKTMKNLITELDKDSQVLDNLKMVDSKGKERKISKTAIENIKIFLAN